ncbi:MAG: UDP-glucose/GDP-mannose dehydrogenase family protein [Coxiellaceae bacterium]|nr:UDP-glucose/GDP-mannose dehydrogenase family protein [Coxiellaceae bacterium]
MKVAVYGAGYVGLVSAVCIAYLGHEVICIDVNKAKIDKLNNCIIDFFEPQLEEYLNIAVENKLLSFCDDIVAASQTVDVHIIAVGTPGLSSGKADLKFVNEVVNSIMRNFKKNSIILNKSTVPVGTANEMNRMVSSYLNGDNSTLQLTVASCPEFLREGQAVRDFLQPDRIVVGTTSSFVKKIVSDLFEKLIKNIDTKMVYMSETSAELTKYTANAFLAMKVSFINEISRVAEKYDANIYDIKQGIGFDNRIGDVFMEPGFGYGGSCFPKDVQSLKVIGEEQGLDMYMCNAIHEANVSQIKHVYSKLHDHYLGNLNGVNIGIWGLSFKPNTDDIRDAPSLYAINKLLRAGATIYAYDPQAMQKMNIYFNYNKSLVLCDSKMDVLNKADCLLICTEWDEFKVDSYDQFDSLSDGVIVDTRNILDPNRIASKGLIYYGIGLTQPKSTKNFAYIS